MNLCFKACNSESSKTFCIFLWPKSRCINCIEREKGPENSKNKAVFSKNLNQLVTTLTYSSSIRASVDIVIK